MRKSISDWRRNSFPDTVVIWGGHGHTQVSKAHTRHIISLYFPSHSPPNACPFFAEICLLECWVMEEFWTSVWKLFWICHNKRDIVSAMQPPSTNSAEITGMWQKLRKSQETWCNETQFKWNQSTLKRSECIMKIIPCHLQIPFLFLLILAFVSGTSIPEFAHLFTCDSPAHFQTFW